MMPTAPDHEIPVNVAAAAQTDPPIENHALIGDCHGAALITSDGCIDWATLRRIDEDPVFCRLLDDESGGYWSIRPTGHFSSRRAYVDNTNLLRTVFETARGQVALLDFMPVGRKLDAGVHDYVHLNAPGWIVRRLEGIAGRGRVRAALPAVPGFHTGTGRNCKRSLALCARARRCRRCMDRSRSRRRAIGHPRRSW